MLHFFLDVCFFLKFERPEFLNLKYACGKLGSSIVKQLFQKQRIVINIHNYAPGQMRNNGKKTLSKLLKKLHFTQKPHLLNILMFFNK